MISAKIDVTKIDKAKLFEGKNGAKYLDIVLMESPNNAYGNDYMVVQSVSKEERLAGKRGAILGNGKNMGGNYAQPKRQAEERHDDKGEDVPW